MHLHVLNYILLVLVFAHNVFNLILDFLVEIALLVTFFKSREHLFFNLHEHLVAALLDLSLQFCILLLDFLDIVFFYFKLRGDRC